MKKASGVVIIVLTAVLSAVTWVLIRKTSKIKIQRHKTDENKEKIFENLAGSQIIRFFAK